LVPAVRAAIASQNIARAEDIVRAYRAARGTTPEAAEAVSWLARGALAAKQLDKAAQHAAEAYDLTVGLLKQRRLEAEPHLQTALGAAIETHALVLAQQGARSDAVATLRRELQKYRDSPIHKRLAKNINLLSLEGQPALPLDTGEYLDRPAPRFAELRGKAVLLFFWAHWCPDCKAQGPIIAKLFDKYRSQGLVVVAPTQRYGYVLAGKPAGPAEELKHIVEVRNQYYSFLRGQPVPVSEANHKTYGVSSTPTLALVDRQGVVRTYNPGRMTEEALEAAIVRALQAQPATR
jgi:thiol-disulfide isomerase/thioredoxin